MRTLHKRLTFQRLDARVAKLEPYTLEEIQARMHLPADERERVKRQEAEYLTAYQAQLEERERIVAGYAVAVDWKPIESGKVAVDFRRVAAAGRRRESHGRRPGHRRVRTASRAGPSSDDGPSEPPAVALAKPTIYSFAVSRCPSCGGVLLWSDGRLVCATRSCPSWGMPA